MWKERKTKMKADLHIHSHQSDGTQTMEEIIVQAKKIGLDMIAITDHDTVDGFYEYQNLNSDFPVLAGIELSTYQNGKPIHILGYFYHNNPTSPELNSFLKETKEKRNDRIQKIIYNLKEYFNIEINYDDVKKGSHGVIARPHLAREISQKYGCTFEEVFDKYLGDDSPAYEPINRLETKEGIELLHRNGALAVLAHPIYLEETIVEEIIKLGIDGIEVYYQNQEEEKLKRLANEYNLLITGGSDYHGDIKESQIGSKFLAGDELEILLNKLK